MGIRIDGIDGLERKLEEIARKMPGGARPILKAGGGAFAGQSRDEHTCC